MGIFHDFFARNYLSISKITWKMALSLKLPIKDFFLTQCIILLLFLLFSQIKKRGAHWAPPPIITKVYLPLIITKVKKQHLAVLSEEFKFTRPPRHYMNILSIIYSCKHAKSITGRRIWFLHRLFRKNI